MAILNNNANDLHLRGFDWFGASYENEMSHLSKSLSVVSRNDPNEAATAALLTSSSTGRMASTAFCVLVQSDRSAHTG